MQIIEIAAGILFLLTIAATALCAHYLQQVRDELREMNGKKKCGATTARPGAYSRR